MWLYFIEYSSLIKAYILVIIGSSTYDLYVGKEVFDKLGNCIGNITKLISYEQDYQDAFLIPLYSKVKDKQLYVEVNLDRTINVICDSGVIVRNLDIGIDESVVPAKYELELHQL